MVEATTISLVLFFLQVILLNKSNPDGYTATGSLLQVVEGDVVHSFHPLW